MKSFEGKHLNFKQRLFTKYNLAYLVIFIFYSYLCFTIDYYFIAIESLLFIILIFLITKNSKTYIYKVLFKDENIIFFGERFNKEWKENIKLNEVKIVLKGKPSRNICSREYYLCFINKNNRYQLNHLNTFSNEEILKIFNYFKEKKNEKINYDEKYLIERIQEKIDKCP